MKISTKTRYALRLMLDLEQNQGDFSWVSLKDVAERQGVSKKYLDYLNDHNISWIAAGKKHVDLKQAMAILDDEFCIKRLAVVGGGKINGGFLKAGLVDEISLLIGPGVAGRTGQPAVFDGLTSDRPTPLTLKSVKSYAIIIKRVISSYNNLWKLNW